MLDRGCWLNSQQPRLSIQGLELLDRNLGLLGSCCGRSRRTNLGSLASVFNRMDEDKVIGGEKSRRPSPPQDGHSVSVERLSIVLQTSYVSQVPDLHSNS